LKFKAGKTAGEWDTRSFKMWKIIIFSDTQKKIRGTHSETHDTSFENGCLMHINVTVFRETTYGTMATVFEEAEKNRDIPPLIITFCG